MSMDELNFEDLGEVLDSNGKISDKPYSEAENIRSIAPEDGESDNNNDSILKTDIKVASEESAETKAEADQTITCSFCKEDVLKAEIFMHTRMHLVVFGQQNLSQGIKGDSSGDEHDSDESDSEEENEESEQLEDNDIKAESNEGNNGTAKSSKSSLNFDFQNLTKEQMEGLYLLKCSFCKENVPKMFIKEHTEKHVKSPMKNHFCPHCGKSFTDKWKLNQHVTIHTGEKPHQCPTCEQSFRLKMSLKRHTEIVHTKLCLYSCDQCGESFNTKRGLQTHLETKHGIEVGFKCDQCNNRYLTEKGLEEHKQSDNCFKHCCHHCGKMFKIKSKLEAHAQSHLDEKVYKASCHLCGKGFTAKTSLQEHERMHLNLKQFVCECGKAFNRKNGLIAHKKTHLNHL